MSAPFKAVGFLSPTQVYGLRPVPSRGVFVTDNGRKEGSQHCYQGSAIRGFSPISLDRARCSFVADLVLEKHGC
jgi:hypothetical protein